MKKSSKPSPLAVAVAIFATLAIGGCTASSENAEVTSDSHMSRVKLYNGVEELDDDSVLVVIGTVEDQEVVADIDPVTDFTLNSLRVSSVIKGGEGLTGEKLTVRQFGSSKSGSTPELMENGGVYLLYLTESELEGELADHYYITGANAGIYSKTSNGQKTSTSNDAVFARFAPQEGEDLPVEITVAEAKDISTNS